MTSRRAVLAGLGTLGTTSLAGCSSLPFSEDEPDEEDISIPANAVEPVEHPDPAFPVPVPQSLAEDHRERARTLLEEVPAEPSVPNAAVAEELRADREHTAGRLSEEVEVSRPIERLSRWRSRRNGAASVRGAYRAATGEDDAVRVRERRRAVREALGAFVAAHEYRAATPLEAVLAHAPVEDLVADAHGRTRPDPGYPRDPVARPFRAGDVLGGVELAEATLEDARGVREAYLGERAGANSQWAAVIDATRRLRLAVYRTRTPLQEFLDVNEPPFEADLAGTPARSFFRRAQGAVETGTSDHDQRRFAGDHANAVLEAGRLLAGLATLRTAIEEIRDGAHQEEVTVQSVTRTADRAREAIVAVEETGDPRLATRILRPALLTYNGIPDRLEEGYGDAARIQGELAWAERYARVVPDATAFVIDRLG